MPDKPSAATVATFYDQIEAVELVFGHEIHLGYWPDGEPGLSLTEAQQQLSNLVLDGTAAGSDDRVLDLGCGTGGPARTLAATTGASVTGVTLSSAEADCGKVRSAEEGLDGLTDFIIADAVSLPFPDQHFDAAFAIESLLHMTDRSAVLREVFRVLRPGARFVVSDLTMHSSKTSPDEVYSATTLELHSFSNYTALFTEAGFDLHEIRDMNEQTRGSYPEFVTRIDRHYPQLAELSGEEAIDTLKAGLEFVGNATVEETFGYIYLIATKP